MKNNISLIASARMLIAFFVLPVACLAQDGSLDLTFDTDGIVTTSFGTHSTGSSVAIQSDGKIVVAGHSFVGALADFALTRYNTNGSLDTTFDTDGKVTTDLGNSDDWGIAAAIQSDGKIVVAGYSNYGSNYDVALVRYNTNGSLDTTFDTDGKVTTAIGSSVDFGFAVALQSDGKIVVVGYSSVGGSNTDFAMVRYNTDGSLDTTFDTDGKVTTPIGTNPDQASSIAIQSDGKIVVAGAGTIGSSFDVAVVRYNTNGSLDTTFDTDGIVTTAIGSSADVGYSVAIQSDGKIVVAGYSSVNFNIDVALIRYNTNGSLDITFDTDGIVTTAIGISEDDGYSVAIQSDGKIVVGGSTYNGSNQEDFALLRYSPNGSLDSTFDTDGIVTTQIGATTDAVRSIAIQSDGKIVVSGYKETGPNTYVFALARYNNTIPVGINETDNQNSEIKIYPNPFSSSTTILSDKILNSATLKIYNIYGQQVKQLNNLSGQSITLPRDNLSGGVYFIQVIKEDKIVIASKLVVD